MQQQLLEKFCMQCKCKGQVLQKIRPLQMMQYFFCLIEFLAQEGTTPLLQRKQ